MPEQAVDSQLLDGSLRHDDDFTVFPIVCSCRETGCLPPQGRAIFVDEIDVDRIVAVWRSRDVVRFAPPGRHNRCEAGVVEGNRLRHAATVFGAGVGAPDAAGSSVFDRAVPLIADAETGPTRESGVLGLVQVAVLREFCCGLCVWPEDLLGNRSTGCGVTDPEQPPDQPPDQSGCEFPALPFLGAQ